MNTKAAVKPPIAPETFAKAYPAEIIDKISYGYNARKLIHAIIAGEKV